MTSALIYAALWSAMKSCAEKNVETRSLGKTTGVTAFLSVSLRPSFQAYLGTNARNELVIHVT